MESVSVLAVGLFILATLLRSGCEMPRRPESGVQLYSDETEMILQNNSVGNQSVIGTQKGVLCISAADIASNATWLQPNGQTVPDAREGNNVFMNVENTRSVELLRTTSIRLNEGVYTCQITDENNVLQILHIGLYMEGTQNAIPLIKKPLQYFPVVDDAVFALNCTTTRYPPTYVTWIRDGVGLNESEYYHMTQILADGVNATYYNLLLVTEKQSGEYLCSVASTLSGGTALSNTLGVKVPSPPSLMIASVNFTSITVGWSLLTSAEMQIIDNYTLTFTGGCNLETHINTVILAGILEYKLLNLDIGASYVITIKAINALGSSSPSSTTTETVGSAPTGAPQQVMINSTNSNMIRLVWKEVECSQRNGNITGYLVYCAAKSNISSHNDSEMVCCMTFTFQNLEPDSTYVFWVAAVNSYGTGPPSNLVEGRTEKETTKETLTIIIAATFGGIVAVLTVMVTCIAVLYYRRRQAPSIIMVKSQDCLLSTLENVSIDYSCDEPDGPAEPMIEDFPDKVAATEGEYVLIQVSVYGNPQPSLAWLHDGESVISESSIELWDDGVTLIIPCVEPKHIGTYCLVASNVNGSFQKELSLSIEKEDEHPLQKSTSLMTENNPVPLSSFEQYVARCHSNNCEAFQFQFMCLCSDTDKPTTMAFHMENKMLNRFKNIVAYDDNRISLSPIPGCDDCQHDYINASYIDGYNQPHKFIATQGPLPHTVTDFWRLVWQEHCPLVAMLCNIMETNRVRCQQYWPDSGSQSYGPFAVVLLEEQTFADYIIRTLQVSLTVASEPPMEVKLFHFISWPDHGVPDYAGPLLLLHQRVMSLYDPDKGAILVHCSAGVGRTGTFIAIDVALEQARKEGVVDISGAINRMRLQRMKMVQSVAQYIFIHDSVLESLVCGNTQILAMNLRISIKKLAQADLETGKTGFERQFQVLKKITPNPMEVERSAALKHSKLNRSPDFLPRDQRRVILSGKGTDYIHATFVDGYKHKKAFIVTQGPMQETCADFWRMVYQQGCGTIIMLSHLVEQKREVCHQYWPSGGSANYGELAVELTDESSRDSLARRNFNLVHTKTGKGIQVTQFQVLNWIPDGQCSNHATVVKLLEEVPKVQRRTGNNPIIVHCSDTVGRSGIFCAATTAVECCKTERVVDVFQVVKAMRRQRPGAVLTMEQYSLIYEIALAYTDSFRDYDNFRQ